MCRVGKWEWAAILMKYKVNSEIQIKEFNNFIMDSINRRLNFSEGLDSLEPQVQLQEYRKKVKTFITQIQSQVSALIDRYESRIGALLKENQDLKRQVGNQFYQAPSNIFPKQEDFECISPIKKKKSINSGLYTTSKSNILQSRDFPKIEPMFETQKKYSTYQQQSTQFNPLSKSRFQIQSKKKKQQQEHLIQSLEAGRANLDLNTTKFLTLIGRNEEKEEQFQEELVLPDKVKKNNSLNTSLNSICESLDNSFYAKKAREKSEKKRKMKEANENEEEKKRLQSEKIKKDKALKNLLQGLRNNINSSPTKPPQIIKGTKLMTAGPSQEKTITKSKVMINPVPVDITKRQDFNKKGESPTKKSILKHSAVLSKSIANISSISLHSSGAY